jgi:hypothetical protein
MENHEPCCNISGECEAPSHAKEITNCIHCGKELQERDGKWYTWDAYLKDDPKPQRQSSDSGHCEHCHPMAIDPKNVIEVRYLTDDRDARESEQNELVISAGGNGDWYVAIVPKGHGRFGRSVRICTSGGASSRVPGLGIAIANAYHALIAAGEGQGVTLKTC